MTVKFIIARFSLFYKRVFPCLLPAPAAFSAQMALPFIFPSFSTAKKDFQLEKLFTFDSIYV